MNILPLNTEIPLSQIETDPLVTTHQQTISPREGITDFGDDVVVCMGKYYLSKKDKVVMKRGSKRTREGSTKKMPALSQIIWKLYTPDNKKGALDTSANI